MDDLLKHEVDVNMSQQLIFCVQFIYPSSTTVSQTTVGLGPVDLKHLDWRIWEDLVGHRRI